MCWTTFWQILYAAGNLGRFVLSLNLTINITQWSLYESCNILVRRVNIYARALIEKLLNGGISSFCACPIDILIIFVKTISKILSRGVRNKDEKNVKDFERFWKKKTNSLKIHCLKRVQFLFRNVNFDFIYLRNKMSGSCRRETHLHGNDFLVWVECQSFYCLRSIIFDFLSKMRATRIEASFSSYDAILKRVMFQGKGCVAV